MATVLVGSVAVPVEIVGVLPHARVLAGTGVILGAVAILIARTVCRRAVDQSDADLTALARVGRIAGWLAVGPVIVLLLALGLLVVLIVGILHA